MSPEVGRPARIIELKRALDGGERRFECELVAATSSRVVVLFRFVRDGLALDSYGLFWPRRAYNCYYAVPAGGGPPAFVRFDVVRGVAIDLCSEPPEVRYTDLLLDLWVDASGPQWEDEDEVRQAAASGALGRDDARRVDAARALLARRHRQIAAEVRTVLRELGVQA